MGAEEALSIPACGAGENRGGEDRARNRSALLLGFAAVLDAKHWDSDSNVVPYLALVGIRVLVWALVIWIFLRGTAESRRYLWVNASVGALWSCLLDIPAVFLLAIAPGRIPIC